MIQESESTLSSVDENGPLAIHSRALSKTYSEGLIFRKKFQALQDVSFDVEAGEIFGLLGPDGAGKTTFIKILLGIISKSSGSASMMGQPAGSREGRKLVGYLPEHLRIPPHLTDTPRLSVTAISVMYPMLSSAVNVIACWSWLDWRIARPTAAKNIRKGCCSDWDSPRHCCMTRSC